MRRACALAAGLIVLMGTLALDPAVRPAVWAQAPAVREGLYTLTRRETKVPPDDWSPASLPGHMRILQLLPGNVYMWGEGDQAFYSDYRVGFRDTPQGRITTISLCHRFAGDVVPAGAMIEIRLGNTHNGASQRFVLQGPTSGQRPSPPRKMACRDEHWPAVQFTESARSGPLQAALAPVPQVQEMPQERQAQAEAERVIDGEMLLTFDDDVGLWVCLMKRGYPSLEFTEMRGTTPLDSTRQEVFVWPDGRFRVKVRPGTYRVVVLPSECGTSRYAAEAITVDAPPAAADEKVVVACLTEASNFGRCRSWWLVRP